MGSRCRRFYIRKLIGLDNCLIIGSKGRGEFKGMLRFRGWVIGRMIEL